MATIRSFRDLFVWQRAHKLTLVIYKTTESFPTQERYGLTSQMRRAAVSVSSNIVEGFRRRSVKDSRNFYSIADASLEELKYQLLLARDLRYVEGERYEKILLLAEEVSKMLFGWSKSQLKNTHAT
jgi:four helix bundle protein